MPYVPISGRSSQEIRAQAAAYIRMADTARTAHAKQALLRLATRFIVLAERLEAEECLTETEQPTSAQAEPKAG
jgi:hypothetical protein